MKKPLVFVIENEDALAKLFCKWLNEWNFESKAFGKIEQSVEYIDFNPNAVLLDLKTLNSNGKKLLGNFKKHKTPIILIAHYTNYDIIENNEFYDICPFPVEPHHMRQIVKNATSFHILVQENLELQAVLERRDVFKNFIVHDSNMVELIRRSKLIRPEYPVAVFGEKSVGKTSFLKRVLKKSIAGSFEQYSITFTSKDELLSKYESRIKKNLNGRTTIFEITTPFPEWQGWEKVLSETFHFHAENCFVIPPMRMRPKDIIYFTSVFVEEFNKHSSLKLKGISQATEKRFLSYEWPGNISELKVILEQAALMSNGPWIEESSVPRLRPPISMEKNSNGDTDFILNKIIPMEKLKMQAVKQAYDLCNGNIFEAAQKLKIGRATMYRLLHKYKVI